MFDLGFLSLCIREEKPKQNTPVVKTNKQKTRKPSSVKCIIAQHSRLCFWGSQEAARVFRQELECLLWSRRVNADITSAQRSSQSALLFPEVPSTPAQDSGDVVFKRKLAILLHSQKWEPDSLACFGLLCVWETFSLCPGEMCG